MLEYIKYGEQEYIDVGQAWNSPGNGFYGFQSRTGEIEDLIGASQNRKLYKIDIPNKTWHVMPNSNVRAWRGLTTIGNIMYGVDNQHIFKVHPDGSDTQLTTNARAFTGITTDGVYLYVSVNGSSIFKLDVNDINDFSNRLTVNDYSNLTQPFIKDNKLFFQVGQNGVWYRDLSDTQNERRLWSSSTQWLGNIFEYKGYIYFLRTYDSTFRGTTKIDPETLAVTSNQNLFPIANDYFKGQNNLKDGTLVVGTSTNTTSRNVIFVLKDQTEGTRNRIIFEHDIGQSLQIQDNKVEVKLGTEETNYLFKEDNKFKYIEADLPIPGYETMTWTNTEDYIHNDVLIPEYYSFTELEDELFNYVTQQMKQSFDSMQYETHLDYYNSSEFDTIIQNLPKDKFISQIEVTNNGDNLRFTVQNDKVINLNVKNKIPVVTNDVHVEGSGTEEDQIRVKADSINDALQSKGVSEIQYKSTRDYSHINKDSTQLSIEGDHNILMRSWGGEHLALTTRMTIIDLILNFNGYLNVNERAQNPWDPNNLIWSVRSGSGSSWSYPTTVTNNMSASELLEYGLTPLPVPNSGTQYGRKTPWYSRLTGLDGSRVYYLKFTSTNTRIGEFSLGSHNMTQGEQQVTGPARYHHYTWGYYSQYTSSFPNSFYTNKGTRFNISTLNIQALLSIEKQLFIAWPQNISFEDFYYHHLLGMPKGSY